MPTALIVGSAGQDGTLLGEHLRGLGYAVRGVTRGSPMPTVDDVDEIYYLAAFHHSSQDALIEPGELFANSIAVHVTGLVAYLEAIHKTAPRARLFYAASSLIFGDVTESPQTEATPLRPSCAYGITKATGLQICRYYRRQGVHASVGILYNHESPLRAEKFVSKKIVRAVHAIKRGERDKLVLGDLSARIDWGYAPDFVDAMRRIITLDAADDFIIATGETHSVQDFVELAFAHAGLDWKRHVEEDRSVITRPPLTRVGDASKLRAATAWVPTTSFPAMVRALMDAAGRAG